MFYCTIVFVSGILMPQKSFHFHPTMSLLAMNLMFIFQRHCIKLWEDYFLIRHFIIVLYFPLPRVVTEQIEL
jgi:hypothetical protein